jgi:S1-C subfamily serine protease
MRENESESEGAWQQPREYTSPWTPRDAGDAEPVPGASWEGAGAAIPPEHGDQDAIALGSPASEAGGDRESPHEHRGYPDQPGYFGPRDAAGDENESGYGSYRGPGYGRYQDRSGYRAGGRGEGGYGAGEGRYGAGGHAEGGYGTSNWGLPDPPPRRSRRGGHFGVYLAVAALAAGVGAGITIALAHHGAGSDTGVSASDVPGPHDNAAGSGASASLNQAAVEKRVDRGLVDITAVLRYANETAEGTGMILTASGLVLTNNHVIDQATSVTAKLADSTTIYQAQVIGYDRTDDVALLQLDGVSGLATVSFGNSSQVKIGTPVLALGNADGRGGVTPALGDIDGLNRSIQASDAGADTTEDLSHMLQTNAQIQQGDSGGALANNAGQVIGMVTAAETSGSGRSGSTVGFAIPIDSALAIAQQIADRRPSSTVSIGLPGFLGVEVAQSNSPNPRQQAADEQRTSTAPGFGGSSGGNGSACVTGGQPPGAPASIAPASTGALILGVLCGSAAEAQGLAPGDVITSVNGQAVTTPGSLTAITARYRPRDVVSVGWESTSGARHVTSIVLGSGPAR